MNRLPQSSARELEGFLKAKGFAEDRQSGSHLTLYHERRRLSVTIPVHAGFDLGRGLAVRIIKEAGFHSEDYIEWLHGSHRAIS